MLTTTQAAKRLGVSERRVRQYIEDGRLAATLMGKTWIIQEQALAALKVQKPGVRIKQASSR